MNRLTFEKSLENACAKNYLQSEPFWQSIVVIRGAINNRTVTIHYAFDALKNKMLSENPHTSFYSLCVLESIVIHCGTPIHEEVSNAINCETYVSLVNNTAYDVVRVKMLELIQNWAFSFRSSHKYRNIENTMITLRNEGHIFPELKATEEKILNIVSDWVKIAACQRCISSFSSSSVKYNCPNCGRFFCSPCSSKMSSVPKYNIMVKIRVCVECYKDINNTIEDNDENSSSNFNDLFENLLSINGEKKLKTTNNMQVITDDESDRIVLLERRVQELEEQQRCNVCFERRRNIAFTCGHTICSRCAASLTDCHICRTTISEKIYLYF